MRAADVAELMHPRDQCPIADCGRELIRTGSGYVCATGHGKILPKFAWRLPKASLELLTGRWSLDGSTAVYRRVRSMAGATAARIASSERYAWFRPDLPTRP